MNKIRIYNDEELQKISLNSNVESVRNKSHIVYKNSFKLWAVKEKTLYPEKTAREIFVTGGFDMNILDDRTPQRRLCSWMKIYRMFGEDYFTDKNKYYYKDMTKKEYPFLSKTFNDPNFIAFVIQKKDDGTFDYRIIRKEQNEKNNS